MPGLLTLAAERRIEYEFHGPKRSLRRSVVMLHEGLGSVALWRDFPRRLAEVTGRGVLVYSRFGYGSSSPAVLPRTPDYMHEEARIHLPDILERLEVKEPILFGHSDGASIALIHAASRRTASGVIALAPHVLVEPLTVASIEKAKVAYQSTDLRTRLNRFHQDVDAAFWGWNDIWLSPAFLAWNIEKLLPAISAPVLAIQGVDDEYGTLDQLERIRRGVPGAVVHALQNCRHSPHRDQPNAVLELARSFLESLD